MLNIITYINIHEKNRKSNLIPSLFFGKKIKILNNKQRSKIVEIREERRQLKLIKQI